MVLKDLNNDASTIGKISRAKGKYGKLEDQNANGLLQ